MAESKLQKYMDGVVGSWINIPMSSAMQSTGTLRYRRIGSIVEVIGDNLQFSANITDASAQVIGTISNTSDRPKVNTPCVGGARTQPMQCNAFSNGNLAIYKPTYLESISSTTLLYFHAMYIA